MKLVATIEENKPVQVQRYEGDLIVGNKHIPVANFCLSLMSQLPIGAHFAYMNDHLEDFKDYFRGLNETGDFMTFLSAIIEAAPYRWTKDHSAVTMLIQTALKVLPSVTTETPEVVQLIANIANQSGSFKNAPNTTDLFKLQNHLTRIILSSPNAKDVSQEMADHIYNDLLSLLNNQQAAEIRTTIEKLIPHLDKNWFNDLVIDSQKRSKHTLHYYSGPVPKNVSYMGVTSRGTSYVYDVPAQYLETTFQGEKIGKIGYPRLLFFYKLNEKGVVSSMSLYAAKAGDSLSDDMVLYEYPYSHVFGNGSVCWNFSDITVEMLPYAAELFLSANNSTHARANVYELFMENKDQDFDEKKLKPITKLRDVL